MALSREQQRPDRLPALRSPGREDRPREWQHVRPLDDPRSASRLEQLEVRMSHQERSAEHHLERALRIKQDIASNYDTAHGIWQDEKQARHLLQEHIRTITDVVRKITSDIQLLESRLQTKQTTSADTRSAVNNLEMHHVAGLTDVRGRVARCDNAISRLAVDMKTFADSTRLQQQQDKVQRSETAERLRAIEVTMSELTARLDKSDVRHEVALRQLEGGTSQQVAALDSAARLAGERARHNVEGVKTAEMVERQRLEARVTAHVDAAAATAADKQEKTERQLTESMQVLQQRLESVREDLRKEQERTQLSHQSLERQLQKDQSEANRKIGDDVARLKSSCNDGFVSVHDSISSMREVLDGKRHLLEEQIKKDIRHLQKMVVLI